MVAEKLSFLSTILGHRIRSILFITSDKGRSFGNVRNGASQFAMKFSLNHIQLCLWFCLSLIICCYKLHLTLIDKFTFKSKSMG